jgi:hypothetical protein
MIGAPAVVAMPGGAATSSGATFVIESTSNVVQQNQLSTSGSASGWQTTGGLSIHGAGAPQILRIGKEQDSRWG